MHEEIRRSVNVSAEQSEVWRALSDVQRVASWIRIVGEVREIEPQRRYSAVLEDRVGPFALRADLIVTVTAEEPRLRVEAAGEDRQVASRITAKIDIDVADLGSARRVDVSGSYDIIGRVATLGAGAIRKKGAHVLDEFMADLGRELGSA
ncbi:MAG: SRPBCC family protein [Chloroflexi bacterium]|nr:SRPBCC family protein [Chloroflexota bacterium]